MKVEYDPKHDVMNIELISNTPIAESVELDDGVILDYSRDKNGGKEETYTGGIRSCQSLCG